MSWVLWIYTRNTASLCNFLHLFALLLAIDVDKLLNFLVDYMCTLPQLIETKEWKSVWKTTRSELPEKRERTLNEKESKQLKSNRDGKKSTNQSPRAGKRKIDDADWSVTIETWTFYPQDFDSFILLKRRQSDHRYNERCTEQHRERSTAIEHHTRDSNETKSELDQLENIRRNDEHLGKWCLENERKSN